MIFPESKFNETVIIKADLSYREDSLEDSNASATLEDLIDEYDDDELENSLESMPINNIMEILSKIEADEETT